MEDPACTHAREHASASVSALERGEGFVVVKRMTVVYRSARPALCALEQASP